RRWRLLIDESGGLRLSGFNWVAWSSGGKTTAARCVRSPSPHKGPAPEGGCCCGLYSVHPWAASGEEGSSLLVSGPSELGIVGLVEAWGIVQLHPEGFRAQYARPAALALLGFPRATEYGRLVAGVATAHGVEVIEARDLDDFSSDCARAGMGMSRR